MAQDNTSRTTKMPVSHHVEEQIRQRAYELYESRGREDGHDVDDWLTAEEEITKRSTRTAAA
jgi:Protein of unknown function (DUF2934)